MLNKIGDYSTSVTLTLDRKKFVKTLQTLKKVTPVRTTDKSLQRARIFKEDDAIYVASSNTEQTLKRKICSTAKLALDGNFGLFTVLDFARKAKTDEIELSFNERGSLQIKSGAINFTDTAFKKDMWELDYRNPAKSTAGTHSFSYPIDELRRAFSGVAYAMSYEETRYYLNGVYMHQNEDNSIAFVATDGHRLSKRVLNESECSALPVGAYQKGVIIPKETVKFFLEFTKGLEGFVIVRLTESSLSFEIDDMLLMTRLIDGTYPDYTRVIPRDNHLCISVKRAELLENLDIFSIQKKSSAAIEFSFDANTDALNIRRKSKEEGDIKTAVGGAANEPEKAESARIGLVPKYVIDMLGSIHTPALAMCIGMSEKKDEDEKPYFVHDGGPLSFLAPERCHSDDIDVIMPKRI